MAYSTDRVFLSARVDAFKYLERQRRLRRRLDEGSNFRSKNDLDIESARQSLFPGSESTSGWTFVLLNLDSSLHAGIQSKRVLISSVAAEIA